MLDAPPNAQGYEQGSWGPQAALDLAGPRGWRLGRDACAEQVGLTGDQLVSFPQGFTHPALISAAINLDRSLG